MATADDPVWREGRLRNENEAAPAMSLAAQAALRGVIGNDIGPPSPEEVALQNYVNANVNSNGEPSPQVLAQFKTAQGGNPPLGEVSGMPAGQPMPPAPGQMMPPAPQPGGGAQIKESPDISQLEQRRNEAWQQGIDRSEPYRQVRESAFGQVQGLANELEATSAFRPRLEGLPTYHAAPVDPQQFTNFGAAATVFASLASLLTRQPLTAALNAAGQAMQGYSEGRFAQVDQDLKVFRTQFDSAMGRNRQMLDEYNSILNDKKLNFATRYEVLKAAAAGEGDEITRSFLQAGKYEDAIRTIDARDRASNALQKQYEALDQALKIAQMRYGGQGAATGFDPQTIVTMAQQYRAGDQSVLRGLGYGAAGVQARQAVLNEVSRQEIEQGGTGRDISANAASRTSLISTQRNLQTYVARTEGILGKVDLDIRNLVGVAQQGVGPSGVPLFDKWLQQGRRASGDPTIVPFDVALQTVKNEYARIMSGPMSNAQLHVSAMEHADQMINGAMNIEQLNAGLQMMRADMQNAYTSYGGELSKIQQQMRSIGAGSAPSTSTTSRSFATEDEARQAKASGQIKPGDTISIGGREATVR